MPTGHHNSGSFISISSNWTRAEEKASIFAGSDQLNDDAARAQLRREVLKSLATLDFATLSGRQRLELLRAGALVCIRLGAPDAAEATAMGDWLNPHFPADDDAVNRELARLLVYVNAPGVVQKTLTLMQQTYELDANEMSDLLARNRGYGDTIARMLANQPELQKLHYARI